MQKHADVDEPPAERGARDDTVERMLTAAFRILIKEGAHALTPQRVHRETGLARTTVYRNWPTRADLMATMLERATGNQDVPDFIDELDHDLKVAVSSLVFRFNRRPLRPLFGALVEHGRQEVSDDEGTEVEDGNQPGGFSYGGNGSSHDLAGQYIDGVLSPIRDAIKDGMRRGDLAVTEVDAAVLELCGPLLAKHVLLGQLTTEADGQEAAERFISRYRA